MTMPLEGIRVLDLTTMQQGPVAAQYLGDMGADVIKIEDPIRGDPNRGLARTFGVSTSLPHGRTVPLEAHNRNKRGLAVDLKTEAGRQVIYTLVKTADVFMQNLRPGAAANLGVDYETLSKLNPQLIYASANCFGPKGPEADWGGNDLVATARSGFLFQIGDPARLFPVADTIADRTGAIMLAYAVVLALFARERLGVGQEVNTSLLGSMIHLQGRHLASVLLTGQSYGNMRKARRGPFWYLYRCADDRWLAISNSRQPDKYWPLFCKALDIADLAFDPRFDSQQKREQNSDTLIPILDEVFATKAYDEWAQILKRECEGFLFNYARPVSELASDPQVIENEYIVDFDHPVLGRIKMEGVAATLSKTPGSIRLPAPELGEHTEEILQEAGFTWDDILRLKELKVIP